MAEEKQDLDTEKGLVDELFALLKRFKAKGIVVQIKGGMKTPATVNLKYR